MISLLYLQQLLDAYHDYTNVWQEVRFGSCAVSLHRVSSVLLHHEGGTAARHKICPLGMLKQ